MKNVSNENAYNFDLNLKKDYTKAYILGKDFWKIVSTCCAN